MKAIAYIRWADPPLWKSTLANCLPLWLLSFILLPNAVFRTLAGISFMLFFAVLILLLWIRWITPELILYSFFPIIPSFIFDEMSASHEVRFILLCTLLLSFGIVGYRLSLHKGSLGAGWLILLVVFVGTWALASNANQNYWQMVSDLGYGCDPYNSGCPAPVPANGIPWWVLFFRL